MRLESLPISTAVDNTTPSPGATVGAADTLEGITGSLLLWTIVGIIAVSGGIILFARLVLIRGYFFKNPGSGPTPSDQENDETSIVRSWIAVVLVGGLLLFGVASFGVTDVTLRSTVIGGVVAASSAAIAYYFAGKAANEARRDLLNAQTGNLIQVPRLQGLTVDEARKEVTARGLLLAFEGNSAVSGTDGVASTSPDAGAKVAAGSYILVRTQ